MNELSGVPKLKPKSAANQIPGSFNCAGMSLTSSFKPAGGQRVDRHDREAHVAHLEVEPCAFAPRSGEEHILLAMVLWFSPGAWKRSCFVCRRGMFEHQSRGQPVTADLESIVKKAEKP